jgi:N-acetylglutamate synthase-like GNAT family acetyltransferase
MSKTNGSANVTIRRARKGDAARLAVLSGELGYPATTREMRQRLKRILRAPEHRVFVAEKNREVIGWLHLTICDFLETASFAEINGLIVAEGQRSAGAGGKLIEAGRKWALQKKCSLMHVRSNVIRRRAHAFYERQGFIHYKTSKIFRKPL